MNPFDKLLGIKNGNAELITGVDATEMLETMQELAEQLDSYKKIFALQQAKVKRATRVYKLAKALPDHVFPDIGELIDWLLDRSGRKEAQSLREASRRAFEKLSDFGDVEYDKVYEIPGSYILNLRTTLEHAE